MRVVYEEKYNNNNTVTRRTISEQNSYYISLYSQYTYPAELSHGCYILFVAFNLYTLSRWTHFMRAIETQHRCSLHTCSEYTKITPAQDFSR